MSTSSKAPQNVASVNEFLNAAATETVPLFEHLEFDFLLEYDVFAPARRGRTRVHKPPDLFCGFLHCYYENVYGTRPVTRELQHSLVWYYCALDKPPSRDTIDRFLTDLEHVVDDVFDRLVEQAPPAACSTPRTLSIRPTSKRSNTTTPPRGTTIQQPRSTTTASPVHSSQLAQRSRQQRNSHKPSKRIRRRRCASHVTRSPSIHLDAWRQRLRYP